MRHQELIERLKSIPSLRHVWGLALELGVSSRYRLEVCEIIALKLTSSDERGRPVDNQGRTASTLLKLAATGQPRIASPDSLVRCQRTVHGVRRYSDLCSDPEHSESIMRAAFLRSHGLPAFERLLETRQHQQIGGSR